MVDEALRLLERRDLSRAELERRLQRAGVDAGEASSAAAALVRTGIVDDARYASLRAAVLAERGWGDEGIRFRLAEEGVPEPDIDAVLSELEGERERARTILARRGSSRRTLAYLASRGFGEDTLQAVRSDLLAD